MLAPAVLDPSHLFQHVGYAAIVVIVLLGNAGVPAPEESVLVLGGYLAWHGHLHLPLVILVGVVSASLGGWVERLRRAAGFLKDDAALFAAILALATLAFIAIWSKRLNPYFRFER
jgi:hypothetical protein